MAMEKLIAKISESGIKRYKLAEELKITTGSLRNKLNSKTSFTWHEVQKLAQILHLSARECEQIFFTAEVADSATREA